MNLQFLATTNILTLKFCELRKRIPISLEKKKNSIFISPTVKSSTLTHEKIQMGS